MSLYNKSYRKGDMQDGRTVKSDPYVMIAHIDEREEQYRKWKAFHRSVRKYHAGISKASSSKDNSSS